MELMKPCVITGGARVDELLMRLLWMRWGGRGLAVEMKRGGFEGVGLWPRRWGGSPCEGRGSMFEGVGWL